MALLDGLSEIDWARFQHAYGPATDVPDLLRALAWPERAEAALRESAARQKLSVREVVASVLWGNVFHQGTRWGVSAKVVPFLRELLVEPQLRAFLVTYLHHLAVGYPKQEFPQAVDIEALVTAGARVEALGPPPEAIAGDVFGEGEGDGDDWVESVPVLWERDCYLAVEACLPDVAPLIDDPTDAVAMPALALLASFPTASSLQPALWALARGSTLVGRRGGALLVLAQHRAEVSEAVQVALDTLEGLDAVYAAAAEVLSRGGSSSVFSWARLLDVSPELGAQSCAFAGQVSRLVALCLERCTPEVQAEAVDQLTELLAHTKGWAKVPLMQAMLRLTFTPTSTLRPLSALQREVLEELVRDGLRFGSGVELVLRERGLPTTKDGLQTLLGGG